MNVTLSGDAEQFVREEVASGRYDSAQEVVRAGLRLLHEHAILEEKRQARLNEQIEKGLGQLDRGEGIPGDQAFQALWDKKSEYAIRGSVAKTGSEAEKTGCGARTGGRTGGGSRS